MRVIVVHRLIGFEQPGGIRDGPAGVRVAVEPRKIAARNLHADAVAFQEHVTGYAGLTALVFVGLSAVVLFLIPPDNYDIQNPVAFNIGAYLDPQSTPE